jgi:hypothetical protein
MGRLGALMLALGTFACGGHAAPRREPTRFAAPPAPPAQPIALSTVVVADDAPREPARPRRVRSVRIAERVLLRAVHARRPSLFRCYHAARRADPSLATVKVPVTLRISSRGAVESANIDAATPRMQGCIDAVIRRVRVPAPGTPVDVDVPLVFSAS